MGMTRIATAKVDDFAIAVDSGLFIFSTVMSEMTLHQPRFSVVWIDLQNTIDKYLCDFPSFFGNCASGV